MDSTLQQVASALTSVAQNIVTDAKGNPFHHRLRTFTAGSSLVLTLTLRKKSIDPFGRLPWFALEDILFQIPDLPTLNQLYLASPAVASYLENTPGAFPKVVEKVIEHWDRDKGLDRETQIQLRTLVYLWWKNETANTESSSDENPLPKSYYKVAICILHMPDYILPPPPPMVGEVLLPRSTPTKHLRRLLHIWSTIRAWAHAFFHSCMKSCLSAKVERPRNRSKPWPKHKPRPFGVPIHISLEEDCAPSWLEEQRIMKAFLKVFLFCAIHRAVFETKVLDTSYNPSDVSHHPSDVFIHSVLLTHLELKKAAPTSFWSHRWLGNGTHDSEQFLAAWSWVVDLELPHAACGGKFFNCCTRLTPLTPAQLGYPDRVRDAPVPGCFWAQDCTALVHSGISQAGKRGEFRKFGVSFFDEERMLALGLLLPRMSCYKDRVDVAFRWSCLLHPLHENKSKSDQTLTFKAISPELFANSY